TLGRGQLGHASCRRRKLSEIDGPSPTPPSYTFAGGREWTRGNTERGVLSRAALTRQLSHPSHSLEAGRPARPRRRACEAPRAGPGDPPRRLSPRGALHSPGLAPP